MKKILSLLAISVMANFVSAEITHAPWIAMQPDDTIIAPLVHSPFIKKTFGDKKPGLYTMPMMRRVFETAKKKKVESATLQVCGLGHFECYLDGQKVGNHFLDPGWSDYRKEAEYVEFDVLPFFSTKEQNLRFAARTEGSNKRTKQHILSVLLGNGFYNIPRERYVKLLGSFGAPKLKLSLTIRYTDGSIQEVQSDSLWQVAPSPITFSSIYGGEDYDASLEQKGWNNDPKFDATLWQQALVVSPAFDVTLHKQEGTELVVIDTLQPISITPKRDKMKGETDEKDVWIYDFGQNLSGIVELTLKQPLQPGQNIRMRPAELIKENGTLNQKVAQPYLWNYRAPLSDNRSTITDNRSSLTDHRSSRIDHRSSRIWSPQFTYYGFRYVEVQGIHPDSIELRMLHTSSTTCQQAVGSFRCSNDTLNRIHDLIDRAIRSNLASVPTDCPTREKLGWLEQDYLMLPSMLCRYDVKNLYTRLMRQMHDAQQPDGMIPTIAPYYTWFGYGFDDSPEWGAAFILSPWILYQHNGDDSLIRTYYDDMRRYTTYLYTRAHEERDSLGQISKPQHIINYGLGDWYDLGPKGPGYSQLTPNGLTATAIYFEEVQAMSQMATIVGKKDDAHYFTLLADSIREAYNARFDTCTSQTALAMGLSLGLLPDSLHTWAREQLIDDLATPHTTSDSKGTQHWNTLLTAGDIGFVYLVRTMADMGLHAELMQLCTNPAIPGYGMQLDKGATSLTESWQALDNVSNNHLMLGHIMEWLYGYVGGIRKIDGQYVIDPANIPNVDWCECTYMTSEGPITVRWHKNAKGRIVIE